jgi:hypothetical protein
MNWVKVMKMKKTLMKSIAFTIRNRLGKLNMMIINWEKYKINKYKSSNNINLRLNK